MFLALFNQLFSVYILKHSMWNFQNTLHFSRQKSSCNKKMHISLVILDCYCWQMTHGETRKAWINSGSHIMTFVKDHPCFFLESILKYFYSLMIKRALIKQISSPDFKDNDKKILFWLRFEFTKPAILKACNCSSLLLNICLSNQLHLFIIDKSTDTQFTKN